MSLLDLLFVGVLVVYGKPEEDLRVMMVCVVEIDKKRVRLGDFAGRGGSIDVKDKFRWWLTRSYFGVEVL